MCIDARKSVCCVKSSIEGCVAGHSTCGICGLNKYDPQLLQKYRGLGLSLLVVRPNKNSGVPFVVSLQYVKNSTRAKARVDGKSGTN